MKIARLPVELSPPALNCSADAIHMMRQTTDRNKCCNLDPALYCTSRMAGSWCAIVITIAPACHRVGHASYRIKTFVPELINFRPAKKVLCLI